MEKKVLLKDLVDTGTNLRKQIISKVRVSDQGVYPIGEIWDANTTLNTIVDGASMAFDTLKEVEDKLDEQDAQIQTINDTFGDIKVPDTYAIYSYQSFNADGSVAYGTGKAQLTGIISGDYTQVNIIEDTTPEFVGQKFYILTNAVVDGTTLNQLYNADKQPVGIAVKITLYSDTTYKACNVKEYVDYMVSHYAGGGIVGPSTVDSAAIIDGSVKIEDLSDEVKDKLQATVDEEDENVYIP